MTFGSPPSMIATHELVVPRSIPITLLISSSSFGSEMLSADNHVRWRINPASRILPTVGWRLGDRHLRRPQQAIVQGVARDVLFDDRSRGMRAGLDLGD